MPMTAPTVGTGATARSVRRVARPRPPRRLQGYDETWLQLSRAFRSAHPLCAICKEQGRLTPSQQVHHVQPLTEGGARLDPANLQALCRRCHSSITARGGRV